MARINVEDSLFSDSRFIDLLILTKCKFKALGMITDAWRVAQQFFLNEDTDRMIPVSEWKKRKCADEVIEVGLAEVRGEFIYVAGSKENFAWLITQYENGKKGGRPRKTEVDQETQNNPRVLKTPKTKPTETHRNPLTLSLSPTQKEKEKEKKSLKVLAAPSNKVFLVQDHPSDPMALGPDEISKHLSGVLSKLEPPHDKSPREGPKKLTLAKLDGKKAATQATA